MTDVVVLSSFQHGRTLFVRGQITQFDPRTFVELEANGLVREKTATDLEPKPAPAPVSRPPARSRAVKPAPPLESKPSPVDVPDASELPATALLTALQEPAHTQETPNAGID